MIKKLIAGLCLMSSVVGFAQENNSSPYSFYGIGDAKFKGTAENRAMGGVGVLSDSIHINLQNPASYGELKFATYTLAATTSKTKLATSSESSNAGRTTIDYLAIGLPFKKFGVGFGLMPYTSVGYRIQNTTDVYPDGYSRIRQFQGDGGLNRVFGGASYKLTKGLSVGVDVSYYFGKIQTSSNVGLKDVPLQYITKETNTTSYGGFTANFGAYYHKLVNKKYTWVASAVYSVQGSLNSNLDSEVATIQLSSTGGEVVVDSRKNTLNGQDAKMPYKLTAGSGFGVERKWFVMAEVSHSGTSVLGNRFDNITNVTFENSTRVSVGGFYIPKYYSFTSYLSRITYRGGLRYENTGMIINGQSIKDKSASLGLGLPLSGIGGSNLNLGVEYGQRGTKAAGLIQENYFSFFVGLSFNDRWFMKRKFE